MESENGTSLPGMEKIFVHVWGLKSVKDSESFPIKFLKNGYVKFYNKNGITSWKLIDNHLHLITGDGIIAISFDMEKMSISVNSTNNTPIYNTEGNYILSLWDWEENLVVRTRTLLKNEIKSFGWKIGENTYGRPSVIHTGSVGPGYARIVIGKYCSIGGNVVLIAANHRTDTVTTYPFKQRRRFWPSAPSSGTDYLAKGDLVIGNDVWIGSGVTVTSGVKVGDGAVLGADCIVTKDVPPYAIVAGNPARIIKMRFSPEIIKDLLEIAWWNWPNEVVDEFIPMIVSTDIDAFIAAAKNHNKSTEKY